MADSSNNNRSAADSNLGSVDLNKEPEMPDQTAPPKILDPSERYRKGITLGQGTYGTVYKAFDNVVFAVWYRAPEILYGSKYYGPGVDIWAAGCIFAELLLRRPFLPGTGEIDQLGKIFAAFGTPRLSQWPDMTSLPDYIEFQFVATLPRPI